MGDCKRRSVAAGFRENGDNERSDGHGHDHEYFDSRTSNGDSPVKYLLILAFAALAFGQDLTDAQRAEHFKLQARMLGAASNVNLTQLQLQEAQKQAQTAGEAFTAAKAAYEAHLKAMCPGTEPDPSFDEPKCKPKPEPTSVGTSGAASDQQN